MRGPWRIGTHVSEGGGVHCSACFVWAPACDRWLPSDVSRSVGGIGMASLGFYYGGPSANMRRVDRASDITSESPCDRVHFPELCQEKVWMISNRGRDARD